MARRNDDVSVKAKEEAIEMEGEVIEALPDTFFRIELENGHQVLAKLAGRLTRRNSIPGSTRATAYGWRSPPTT